ncbi:MAG: polysaccharide deacetylase family protein [Gammaproteobacteria bacterium]|nr:polysaccharide deacetylase family protein [Gammaproteobacteria bacterium]
MARSKRNRLLQLIPDMLLYTGLLWCWRFLNRKKLTVLMVHGVVDENARQRWMPLWERLSLQHFDRVIGLLSKYYHFVSLDEAAQMLAGRQPMKPYSMVLTFDDGYQNNLTYAGPVLKKHAIPAIIYLATGYINKTSPFWIDRLDYALQSVEFREREFLIADKPVRISATDRNEFQETYKALRIQAKAVQRSDEAMLRELNALAEGLENESGKKLADIMADDDWAGLMQWDGIKQSLADGLSFGAHTVDHTRLEFVSLDVAQQQINDSRQDIETQLNQACDHFCYPNGSYNAEVVELVRAGGFRTAMTSDNGLNQAGDDLLTLKRVPFPVHTSSGWILAEVSGLIAFLSRLSALLSRKS